MAHGDDRGDPFFEQFGRHGRGGVFLDLGRLAGFEEDQRDPVRLHQPGQVVRMNQFHAPPVQFLLIVRVFKAERSEPELAVVHPVPVKMNHIEGLLLILRFFQCFFERGISRRLQDLQFGQSAQFLDRLDERQ